MVVMIQVAGCAATPGIEVEPGEVEDPVGKADGSEARVEVKVTVAAEDVARARSRFGLTNAVAEDRAIWFYDSPALALLEAGTILRARKIDGDDDDSTVKLRPFTAAELDDPSAWLAMDGFKCELDRTLVRTTSSCSLTVVQDRGEIDAVAAGGRTIDKLFSADQEALLARHGAAVAWDEIQPLGPIPARAWKLRHPALPAKATAELWELADGTEILELSLKVAADEADAADAAEDALLDLFDDERIEIADEQEAKTRRALEQLAGATAP